MLITNDFPTPLPDQNRPVSDWTLEERCRFIGDFMQGVTSGMNFASIRVFGFDRVVERDRGMLHIHQKRYFLDGVHKLGIGDEPPAVLASDYHVLSNALGGIRMRGAIESDEKAWFFYLPPTGTHDMALQVDGFPLADYTSWHANNGELLGHPGLVVVITHLHSRGDPYHGGYFLYTGSDPVPAGERCRQSLGEQPPELLPAEFDESVWPEERRFKSYRNFWLGWAGLTATGSMQAFGEAGYETVRHGLGNLLYSWAPRFEAAFLADAPPVPPGPRFARVFAGVHELANLGPDGSDSGTEDSVARVTVQRDLIELNGEELTAEQVAHAQRAVRDAWAGLAARYGVSVEAEFGPAVSSWRFH
jgi:hypothetical protein